ncbi:DNA alkylation repair protein [Nocardiopsis ansamitocini]|uniref:DNA alkylation repair protein n=1 Tax=Nocardiopsis ansamitocini TaxID=1670832 RepID=A0A9W6UG31_9ACTN|nr:DNA alkylation repair protein [Nocardiopsis ansamitocini]GLU46456.1 DNA alkylation repair protein [Nocardiopsis ansamitocini]
MTAHLGLIAAVRERLRSAADPSDAGPMQQHARSDLPFHGVRASSRRSVFADVFTAHPIHGAGNWEDTVRTLWRVASHREERYAAVELTGHPLYSGHQTPAVVDLYEDLVVAGAWWDYVDVIAPRRVGPLLRAHPLELRPLVGSWSLGTDPWLRRAAILCQLGSREQTDTDLLFASIEPSIGHPDLFVRKAIGRALREHAKTDPGSVLKFTAEHGDRMSGLSLREALKHLESAQA